MVDNSSENIWDCHCHAGKGIFTDTNLQMPTPLTAST